MIPLRGSQSFSSPKDLPSVPCENSILLVPLPTQGYGHLLASVSLIALSLTTLGFSCRNPALTGQSLVKVSEDGNKENYL